MKYQPQMQYSAFDDAKHEELIPLDTVCHPGFCIFLCKAEGVWGAQGVDYLSKVYKSPTYADAFIEALKGQQFTLDFHHTFFEGVYESGVLGDGTKLVRILLGS